VDETEPKSIRSQCQLLGISRSGYYYEGNPETEENLTIMRRLDELHLKYPVYGSRKLGKLLEREGWVVNRKRVMRLLQVMGIEAIYQKPKTSEPSKGHRKYPYLLGSRAVSIYWIGEFRTDANSDLIRLRNYHHPFLQQARQLFLPRN
jgi:putative transposase